MKKNLLTYLLLCFLSPFIHAAAVFTLNPQHSFVIWHVNHLGFSKQAGKWSVNGRLVLDKENPQNSKINASIKVADVMTGISELDKQLRGDQFFDVEKFPEATFVGKKIEVTGKLTAKVSGMLTMHGVSKPVTLDVKINQFGANPEANQMLVGISATTMIKRSDFGITTLLPKVGDEVNLEIETEAYMNMGKSGAKH